MENTLIKLKKILNTFTDKELENYELWIDNNTSIDLITIEDDSISLITDKTKLKINGLDW